MTDPVDLTVNVLNSEIVISRRKPATKSRFARMAACPC